MKGCLFELYGWVDVEKSIAEKLKPLFYSKSGAVVGASKNPAKWGFSIFNDLLVKGFKGDLYPINKNEERISEIRCYKSVKDILKPVDLAVIAVPAKIERARKVLRRRARKLEIRNPARLQPSLFETSLG